MAKNIGKFLKEAKKMQDMISDIQKGLKDKRIEATSGGGMVKAVVNGNQEIISLEIEKEVVNPDDIEMLESLVIAALNEAMRKSKELLLEEFKKITGGLPIPGLF